MRMGETHRPADALTADESADVCKVAHALLVLAGRYRSSGKSSESVLLNRAAVTPLESMGIRNGLTARVYANLGWALLEQGYPEEALSVVQQEQWILEELNDPALAECYGRHAVILSRLGKPKSALGRHRDEERIYRDLKDVTGVTRSLIQQVRLLVTDLNQCADAIDTLSTVRALCIRSSYDRGLDDVIPCATNVIYWILQKAADLEDDGLLTLAWDQLSNAEDIGKKFDVGQPLATVKYNRALFAATRLGKYKEALVLAEEAEALARHAMMPDLLRAAEQLLQAIQDDLGRDDRGGTRET